MNVVEVDLSVFPCSSGRKRQLTSSFRRTFLPGPTTLAPFRDNLPCKNKTNGEVLEGCPAST